VSSTERTTTGRLVRTWPHPADPWATMLIVHGLGEHSGRYGRVGDQLSAEGIAVRSFDLIGFGASEGPRAFAKSVDVFLAEIEEELAASRLSNVPAVLLGHSMGGLLAYRYAMSAAPQPDVLVLSSPAFGSSASAIKQLAAPWVAKVAPKLSMPNDIKGEQLSRDPAVGEAYFSDPLVHTKMTTALGAALLDAIETSAGFPAPSVPTYVLHGAADTVVPPQSSAAIGERDGVTRKLYHNLRHETMNEPEGPEVVADIVSWLRETLNR